MPLKTNWVDADSAASQHAQAHNDVNALVNQINSTMWGRWRGAWTSGTPADGLGAYILGDVAVYQGTTYRANTTVTAGAIPQNSLQWDIIAQAGTPGSNGTNGVSFTFQGPWVSGTPYLIGQWVSYSGSLYYCNGNISNLSATPPMDAGWNLGMSGSAAGLVAGEVAMAGAARAGAYLYTVGAGSTSNGSTLSVGQIAASPIFISKSTTVDRTNLYINTANASGLWRLGLYADTGSMYPGALVFEGGTVDGSSTGMKEITLGSASAVTKGVYWVAGKVEGGFAAPRGTNGPVFGVNPASNSNTTDVCTGYICAPGTSGLPTTWPSWGTSGTGVVVTAPRIGVRVTG